MELVWKVNSDGYLHVEFDDGTLLSPTDVHIGNASIETNQVVDLDYSAISIPLVNTKAHVLDKLANDGRGIGEAWFQWAKSPDGRGVLNRAAEDFIRNRPSITYFGAGKMPFSRKRPYSRFDIQGLVGGEIQSYLPQKNKVILAGCFSKDLNPDCPKEVQAGKAGKVVGKAELLLTQRNRTVFPVFVRKSRYDREYWFEGMFICVGGTCDPGLVKEAECRSGRIDKISYVLQLERVG